MHVPSHVIYLSNDCCSPVLASGRHCFPVNVDPKVYFSLFTGLGSGCYICTPATVNDVIIGQLVYKQGSFTFLCGALWTFSSWLLSDSVWTELVSPGMQGWSASPAARGWSEIKWPSSARSGEGQGSVRIGFSVVISTVTRGLSLRKPGSRNWNAISGYPACSVHWPFPLTCSTPACLL